MVWYPFPSSTTFRATFRKIVEISRSMLRTPASRVYLRTSSVSASSAKVMLDSRRPWDLICLVIRWRCAISTFSRSV